MESLRERYAELLSPEEAGFIEAFAGLSEASQCLLARLCLRTGPFYRRSTLCYDEVPDLRAAMQPLCELGWLSGIRPCRPRISTRC